MHLARLPPARPSLAGECGGCLRYFWQPWGPYGPQKAGSGKLPPAVCISLSGTPCQLAVSRCGCDKRCVSSWISTATLASASACWRPWWAQKRSSRAFGSMTRTYAWAPQRSHRSVAFIGLVGARAPVNVAFLALGLRLSHIRLAPVIRDDVLSGEHNTMLPVCVPGAASRTPTAKAANLRLESGWEAAATKEIPL